MKNTESKTSEEWHKLYRHLIEVIDPDGWDRHGNFDYSWYDEKITKNEFFNRVTFSSCMFKVTPLKLYDMLNSGEI